MALVISGLGLGGIGLEMLIAGGIGWKYWFSWICFEILTLGRIRRECLGLRWNRLEILILGGLFWKYGFGVELVGSLDCWRHW